MMVEDEMGMYCVKGWHSQREAVEAFASIYEHGSKTHGLNNTAVHWLFFQPYLFPVEDESDIERIVVAEPVLTQISNVSGNMMGVEIRPDMVDVITTKSVRPRLVQEDD